MLFNLRRFPWIKIFLILLTKTPFGILSILSNKPKPKSPSTWEFSVYSQGGEDGIIDYLASQITNPNQYFVEIGSSNGVANNTAFLALAKKYSGLMVEGDKRTSNASKLFYSIFNKAVLCKDIFVSLKNVNNLITLFRYSDPDILSLDIDGNDYYILQALLLNRILPKVVVVEYNATMGPDACISIPYTEDFDYSTAHPSRLYYGASFTAWNLLLESYNYTHITVDSNGVNSFYVRLDCMAPDFSALSHSKLFRDNYLECMEHGMTWSERFNLISSQTYTHFLDT